MKKRMAKASGRKLRFVSIAVPSRTTATQTLSRLNMNHALRKPTVHPMESMAMKNGSRSMLMPPVVAASHQMSRRLTVSANRAAMDAPSTWLAACHATAAAPMRTPAGMSANQRPGALASAKPASADHIIIAVMPSMSTHSAALMESATIRIVRSRKASVAHPCRGLYFARRASAAFRDVPAPSLRLPSSSPIVVCSALTRRLPFPFQRGFRSR